MALVVVSSHVARSGARVRAALTCGPAALTCRPAPGTYRRALSCDSPGRGLEDRRSQGVVGQATRVVEPLGEGDDVVSVLDREGVGAISTLGHGLDDRLADGVVDGLRRPTGAESLDAQVGRSWVQAAVDPRQGEDRSGMEVVERGIGGGDEQDLRCLAAEEHHDAIEHLGAGPRLGLVVIVRAELGVGEAVALDVRRS